MEKIESKDKEKHKGKKRSTCLERNENLDLETSSDEVNGKDLYEDQWIPDVASSSIKELNRALELEDFVLVQIKAKKKMCYR